MRGLIENGFNRNCSYNLTCKVEDLNISACRVFAEQACRGRIVSVREDLKTENIFSCHGISLNSGRGRGCNVHFEKSVAGNTLRTGIDEENVLRSTFNTTVDVSSTKVWFAWGQ